MRAPRLGLIGAAGITLLGALSVAAARGDERFPLAGAIPDDVFLYAAERHNPQREFLRQYWGEVFEAFKQSGIADDALQLVGTLLSREQMAEFDRLKQRARQLLAGVDWEQLGGGEFVFAERLPPVIGPAGGQATMGMPDMVWLLRGRAPAAAGSRQAQHNFAGLVAILEAVAEEVNRAVGAEALVVQKTSVSGARLASVDLLHLAPGAPALPLSVAWRDDVVLVALGGQLRDDVLALLVGSGTKRPLADSPRFKAAFARLPAPEDGAVFFDMQALLRPVQQAVETIVAAARGPGDVYKRTGTNAQANLLNARALSAYRRGEIEEALALVQQAQAQAPQDSIILYNLACFHALLGHRRQALDWLEQAVAAGFYAPAKISSDPDLQSLRDQPRYRAALAKAGQLAAECCEDVVVNSSKSGEAYKLTMQARQAHEQGDYEQALRLVEQAYEIAPRDARVLYHLARCHARLGHQERALDFLERAVAGGFYCPDHISGDPGLERLRQDERYRRALAQARQQAGAYARQQRANKLQLVKSLAGRVTNTLGILDYSATIETTDGYATFAETICALVPDAPARPFYPVFARQQEAERFDRFLPAETSSFSVSRQLDPQALYGFVLDSLRGAGPSGERLLARWEQLQGRLGVDLARDLIDWIDGAWVTVSLERQKGSVWLIQVRDPQLAREKVAAAVEFLSSKLAQAASKNPWLAMFALRTAPVLDERLEGFQTIQLGLPLPALVWGVAEQQLIFGTSPEAVALCLQTARGEHPGLRSNARLMSEAIVPDGPFSSVTLSDRRRVGQQWSQAIRWVSMVGGMATMAAPDPKVRTAISKATAMLAKLTPVLRKIDFYKSTAACTTFDGRAWHTRKVTHYVSPAQRRAATRPATAPSEPRR